MLLVMNGHAICLVRSRKLERPAIQFDRTALTVPETDTPMAADSYIQPLDPVRTSNPSTIKS